MKPFMKYSKVLKCILCTWLLVGFAVWYNIYYRQFGLRDFILADIGLILIALYLQYRRSNIYWTDHQRNIVKLNICFVVLGSLGVALYYVLT